MKEKFANLINVKTIVTLCVTMVFCYLSVMGKIAAEQFLTIFTTIIAFYFGTQLEKKSA